MMLSELEAQAEMCEELRLQAEVAEAAATGYRTNRSGDISVVFSAEDCRAFRAQRVAQDVYNDVARTTLRYRENMPSRQKEGRRRGMKDSMGASPGTSAFTSHLNSPQGPATPRSGALTPRDRPTPREKPGPAGGSPPVAGGNIRSLRGVFGAER